MPDPIQTLRVGIVGASPERGWAKEAHVPALRQLPGFKLNAVATSSEKSARAAAEAFGAPFWYGDAAALASSDQVDLVSVCVKVPAHREVVLAALAAGKHVYCESPLGCNVQEAEEIAAAAARAGVHAAIGLQGRASPAARRARELVAAGRIGRPLSARIFSTSGGFGPEQAATYAYLEDPQSGANLSTILGGHTLDLAIFVLGGMREIEALSAVQFPSVHLTDTDKRIDRSLPDHLLTLGRHENDCLVSSEMSGGHSAGTPFTFEITGTEGRLALTGGDPHGFQGGVLRLEGDGEFLPPDAPVVAGLPVEATNVAELYAQLGRDIRESTRHVMDFAHAVRMTRLMDAVGLAASTGTRQPAGDWPR